MNSRHLLTEAIIYKRSPLAIELLKRNPHLINQQIIRGLTPISLIVESDNQELLIEFLKLPNALINLPSAAMYACALGKPHLLRILIQHGADASLTTPAGDTALTIATWNFRKECIVELMSTNNNVNSVRNNGQTALINAVNKCDADTVKLILNIPGIGIVNKKDNNGNSALFYASAYGKTDVVKLLLAVPGIDILSKRPSDGKTTLDIAKESRQFAIAKLITQALLKEKLTKIYNLDPKTHAEILQDPIVQEFLTPDDEANKRNDIEPSIPPASAFYDYANTIRQAPTEALLSKYLVEIAENLSDKKRTKKLPMEKSQVNARIKWTDIVSNVYALNREYVAKSNVENQVIARLHKLGYTKDTKRVYQDCLNFIKYNSAIVITFNAKFLRTSDLTSFQLMNFHEKGRNNFARKNTSYQGSREATEHDFFKPIKPELRKEFLTNHLLRPRYAALFLLDRKQVIDSIPTYGHSYIVLRDVVKFNCLFNPRDSMNARSHYQQIKQCTHHHMEMILLQWSDSRLSAIAQRVTNGTLPNRYNQRGCGGDEEEYIEVLLPALDYLDPNIVQHIHIDSNECTLNQTQLANLAKISFTVTNNTENPYQSLPQQFMRLVRANEAAQIERLLKEYPALIRATNASGREAIHIAADNGLMETSLLLLKYGANPNGQTPKGATPLHYTIDRGHVDLTIALINTKGINLNVRYHDAQYDFCGITPVILAAYKNQAVILKYLIDKGADVSLMTDSGESALTMATWNNASECIPLLLKTNGNVNNITKDGRTALINAVIKCDVFVLRQILSAPGLNIINHKTLQGESALYIAVSQGDINKVIELIKVPGIDLEAAKIPGDGKSALQLAKELGHLTIANLLHEKIIIQQLGEVKAKEDIDLYMFKRLLDHLTESYTSSNPLRMTALNDIKQLVESAFNNQSKNKIHVLLGSLIVKSNYLIADHKSQTLKWKEIPTLAVIFDTVKHQMLEYLKSKGGDIVTLTDEHLVNEYNQYFNDSIGEEFTILEPERGLGIVQAP